MPQEQPQSQSWKPSPKILGGIGAILAFLAGLFFRPTPAPQPPPRATSTVSVTPGSPPIPTISTPAPSRSPAPTATSSSPGNCEPGSATCGLVRVDDVPCSRIGEDGEHRRLVANAIRVYMDQHPARFLDRRHLISPSFWDDYYFGVVANLGEAGLVAGVDDCGGSGICGEIVVKGKDQIRGKAKSKHEQYHILTSSGDVRMDASSYRATCSPAGF